MKGLRFLEEAKDPVRVVLDHHELKQQDVKDHESLDDESPVPTQVCIVRHFNPKHVTEGHDQRNGTQVYGQPQRRVLAPAVLKCPRRAVPQAPEIGSR